MSVQRARRKGRHMAYKLARIKVADYAVWKQHFDKGVELLRANGARGGMVFHSISDPHEVVVLMDWENAEMGERFQQSPELREAGRQGGHIGPPELYEDPVRIEI
jgi:heme-degrading monooxygenase HmoA